MIRTLIVDDVPLARENVRIRLQKHTDFSVVGEAGSGTDAIASIAGLCPDLVFLDIQMPDLSGFDVLNQLKTPQPPLIIFVTAHDEYALKAFAANAEHYLLKPIDEDQFEQAVGHARQSMAMRATERIAAGNPNGAAMPGAPRRYLERMIVRDGRSYRVLKTESIDLIEADGNYIRIHSKRRTYEMRMMLKRIEQSLNPARFVRISKSTVINLDSVTELRKLCHGDFEVILADSSSVRLSRRYRDRIAPELD
jgi:two-component system LytT family response regulator